MSNLTELVVSIVDEASAGFEQIANTAESSFGNIDTAATAAGGSLNQLDIDINTAQSAFDSFDTSGLQDVGTYVDEDVLSFQQLDEAASAANAGISSINTGDLGEIGSESKGAADGMNDAADSASLLDTALTALVGLGVAATLNEIADSAGSWGDNMTRLGLATSGVVMSADEVQAKWGGTFSAIQSDTGRTMGTIKESITQMSIAGITDSGIMQKSFSSISGAAFVTGKSIDGITMSFDRIVSSGMISSRTLQQLGLNSADVMKATGMTVDELRTKFQNLTPDERAAMMNMIMDSKYGSQANEGYKQSWQHVQDQLGAAGDMMSRVGGQILLPILVPALNLATQILTILASAIGSLPGPIKMVIGALTLMTAAVIVAMSFKLMYAKVVGDLKAAEVLETIARNTGTTSIEGQIVAEEAGMAAKINSLSAWMTGTAAKLSDTGANYANTSAIEVNTAASFSNSGVVVENAAAQEGNALAKVWNTIASGTLMTATIGLASATWALTVALLANPMTWVVIAVIALAVGLYLLWQHSEAFRNGVMTLWGDLQKLWGVLVQLGQIIVGTLIGAWKTFTGAFFDSSGKFVGLIQGFQNLGGIIQGALQKIGQAIVTYDWRGAMIKVGQLLYNGAKNLLSYITGGMTGGGSIGDAVFKWFQSVDWMGLFTKIGQFLANYNLITILVYLLFGQDAAKKVSDQFFQMFMGVINTVIRVIQFVGMVVAEFRVFLAFIGSLPGRAWAFLSMMVARFLIWRQQLLEQAHQAGMGIVNGVISFLTGLPGRMWSLFLNGLTMILNFAGRALGLGNNVGTNIVNGVMDFVKDLPGKIWDELMNVAQKLTDAAGQLYAKAQDVGNQIANGLKKGLHIASPGILHSIISDELGHVNNAFTEHASTIGASAANLGDTMSSNFQPTGPAPAPMGGAAMGGLGGSSSSGPIPVTIYQGIASTVPLPVTLLQKNATTNIAIPVIIVADLTKGSAAMGAAVTAAAPAAAAPAQAATSSAPADMSGIQTGLNTMTSLTNTAMGQLQLSTTTAFTGMKDTMKTTIDTVVVNNRVGYQNIQDHVTKTLSTLQTATTSGYNGMRTTTSNRLTDMVANNKRSYETIQDKTKNTLTNLQAATTNNNNQVKSSWNNMHDSLISAAQEINTQVSAQVNTLSGNVGTFYVDITYPSHFLGGNRAASRLPAGFPGFAGGPSGSVATSHRDLKLLDTMLPPPCANPDGCYYGGGDSWDFSDPFISDSENQINNWSVNLSDFNIGNMLVSRFQNSTNPSYGNLSDFTHLSEKWIGATHYEYYMNSQKSPSQSLASGGFNCYDGAQLMIALGSAFGLSGSMNCGSWNGIPHCWAVIGGQVMDTTAFQDGYGWRSPSVNYGAGGGSSVVPSFSFGKDEDTGPIVIEGVLKHELVLKLDGVPENIDQAALETILKGMIKDPKILKQIVQEESFMTELKTEIARKIEAIKRANGGGS